MTRSFFIKQSFLVALFIIVALCTLPQLAFAQAGDGLGGAGDGAGGAGDGAGGAGDSPYRLDNPITVDSVYELLNLALRVVLIIVVPLSIFFIVFAGFKFITARGNVDKLREARMNLFYVFVGISIVVLCSVGLQLLVNLACDTSAPTFDVCD